MNLLCFSPSVHMFAFLTIDQKLRCFDSHAGLCTGFGALLLTFLVLGICYRWRQLRRRRSHALPYVQRSIPSNPPNPPNPSSVEEVENGGTYLGVHLFSYKELEEATNHFDSNKELGDGGFGTVYYGKSS